MYRYRMRFLISTPYPLSQNGELLFTSISYNRWRMITIGHVNNIPTEQLCTGMSRNTQSKSYMLTMAWVWDFQSIAMWDTHNMPSWTVGKELFCEDDTTKAKVTTFLWGGEAEPKITAYPRSIGFSSFFGWQSLTNFQAYKTLQKCDMWVSHCKAQQNASLMI